MLESEPFKALLLSRFIKLIGSDPSCPEISKEGKLIFLVKNIFSEFSQNFSQN